MFDFGSFERPNLRTIVLLTVGVAVVAVLVVVIVGLAGRVSPEEAPESASSDHPVPLHRFRLPLESEPGFLLLYPPSDFWSEAQIQPYWTDPAVIGGELLEAEADETIKELLDAAP